MNSGRGQSSSTAAILEGILAVLRAGEAKMSLGFWLPEQAFLLSFSVNPALLPHGPWLAGQHALFSLLENLASLLCVLP